LEQKFEVKVKVVAVVFVVVLGDRPENLLVCNRCNLDGCEKIVFAVFYRRFRVVQLLPGG